MGKKLILDCTLRDGGYCIDWKFGQKNIDNIIRMLCKAGVDYVECGYLNDNADATIGRTQFSSIEMLEKNLTFLTKAKEKLLCMINVGEFDVHKLPKREKAPIAGIRVAFHKNKKIEAIEVCYWLKELGYDVFVQPMVTMDYSDEDFDSLIQDINQLNPFAMYIVDSFGVMKEEDLIRYISLINKSMRREIILGYHAHNNLQLSYSNAKAFLQLEDLDLVVDSTVYGMGRGAGNLNTELIMEHLIEKYNMNYKIDEVLDIYSEILSIFYEKKRWGYTIHNFLSAKCNCHPNYAIYLNEKNTLVMSAVHKILNSIPLEDRNIYNEGLIESLYVEYMSHNHSEKGHVKELISQIQNKAVLLLVPGKSIDDFYPHVQEYVESKEYIIISVNYCPIQTIVDYVFVSNMRRYSEIRNIDKRKLIVTSNVKADGYFACLDYSTLTNKEALVKDNAVLMLIRFLILWNVKSIKIAGLDGYSFDLENNYESRVLPIIEASDHLCEKNRALERMINAYSQKVPLELVTPEKNIIMRGGEIDASSYKISRS